MTTSIGSKEEPRCSFCEKRKGEVGGLVSVPGANICDGCVELCAEELSERRTQAEAGESGLARLPRPREMGAFLDQYVVGQETAKRSLSVAVYNHYKRVQPAADRGLGEDDVEISKSNILLLGPTGSGKTLLAQTLARILQVPFAVVDATGLTEAGYVGEDVDGILMKLVQAADHDLAKAATGIVYIDEIDKIARRGEGSAAARDVSGEGVQQALLKILEGTVASISPQGRNTGVAQGSRSRTAQEGLHLDTSNILFIVAGAFAGLEKVVEARLGRKSIGFSRALQKAEQRSKSDLLAEVMPEDLAEFGMIPEFIGRLPMITSVRELDQDALLRILTEPKNALVRQYRRLFEFDGIELVFGPGALEAIADQAILRGTGARGLRSILDDVLISVMYDVPSLDEVGKVTVTKESILLGTAVLLHKADGEPYPWEDISVSA